MALQQTISTTESIRRLMQPSWPLAHETIRQHTERRCHCRQAEQTAPTNPLANSDPSTHRRSKPIDAVDQCPLLAQSGHHSRADPCPLLEVKRTSNERASMSANDPKRTKLTYFQSRLRQVRYRCLMRSIEKTPTVCRIS